MAAMSNAERQRRWRERHRKGDLFPPAGRDFPPLEREETAPAVTPQPVTLETHGLDAAGLLAAPKAALPCPFYGGTPMLRKADLVTLYAVWCRNCGCKAAFQEAIGSALTVWNMRARP